VIARNIDVMGTEWRKRCACSTLCGEPSLARPLLLLRAMRRDEAWTIPLHVILWATMAVGLIMAMAVILMH
jgi:hypothetical protein